MTDPAPPLHGGEEPSAPAVARRTLPGADELPRAAVYLTPGQLFAAAEPTEVVTVLGSCVSVCLFDRTTAVGGVNHFLVPVGPAQDPSPRYGDYAMEALLEALRTKGAHPAGLRAKVFGGAGEVRAGRPSVGAKNVGLALRALAAAHVPVLASDVGGTAGRKIVFHTDVGAAWVRLL